MSRTIFPAGGAFATYNSLTLQAREDWSIADGPALFDLKSNTRGKIVEGIADLEGKVSIMPKAFSTSLVAFLNKLCPYQDIGSATVGRGNSIFPTSDLPFVVQTKDGKSITYAAGAVTKQPVLTFHSSKPLIGAMELTLLVGGAALLTDSGGYVATGSSSFTEPTADPATEVFDRYALSVGGNAITVDDGGIIFTPTVTLAKVKPAHGTTSNYRIEEIGAMLEFTPLNIDVDTFYSTYFPPTAIGIGAALSGAGLAVTVTGSATGKLLLTIPQMTAAKPGGPQFSPSKPRTGKVQLHANHKFTTGTYSALFTFSAVP